MICGWASPPMAPTRCVSAPSVVGDEHGGEGVRRPPPGRHLGRMARDEREADAAVVQEDTGGGLDEVRAEVQRVGLRQRHPEAVGVLRAQVRGVPVAQAGHVGGRTSRARARTSGGAMARRLDAGGRGGQALGVEERVAVGAVEEHRRAVVADGAPRLDEEMGPLGIVRIGPEPGRLRPRRRRPA